MAQTWSALVTKWMEAGVIDAETAERIRAFETRHAPAATLGWPVSLALGFGALLLGSGVLLFVSAHWDAMSPAMRFTLVVVMVAVFHVAGAASVGHSPSLATALHAVGTVTLGAGLALAGQIFNLDEHWPTGVLLWAIGAAAAWALRRDPAQLAIVAILFPVWLVSEWMEYTRAWFSGDAFRVAACFIFLLALVYFTAEARDRTSTTRRVLMWIGGIALLPAAGTVSQNFARGFYGNGAASPPIQNLVTGVGLVIAIVVPLALAIWMQRARAWPILLAVAWTLALVFIPRAGDAWWVYAWWCVGATALVTWGVLEAQSERINIGAVIFAATVLAFYFSHIMDKLGRSASLVGLGLLFLGGGWVLERTRRRLIARAKGAAS